MLTVSIFSNTLLQNVTISLYRHLQKHRNFLYNKMGENRENLSDVFEQIWTVFLYMRNTRICGAVAKHWALVFESQNGTKVLCEGLKIKAQLVPKLSLGETESNKYQWKRKELGTIIMSGKDILEQVDLNSYNNTPYNLLFNNCHDWVLEISTKLGLTIDERRPENIVRQFMCRNTKDVS